MRGWGVIAALAACLATAVANAGPQQEVGNLVGAVSKTLARETRTVGGTVADAGTSLGNTVTGTSTTLDDVLSAPAAARPGGATVTGTTRSIASGLGDGVRHGSGALAGGLADEAGVLPGGVDRAAQELARGVRHSTDAADGLVNATRTAAPPSGAAGAGTLPGLPGSDPGPASRADRGGAIAELASLPVTGPLIRLLERLLGRAPAGPVPTTGSTRPPAAAPSPSPQSSPGPATGGSPAVSSTTRPSPPMPPAGVTHPLAGMASRHPLAGATRLARVGVSTRGRKTGRPVDIPAARGGGAGDGSSEGSPPVHDASPAGTAGSKAPPASGPTASRGGTRGHTRNLAATPPAAGFTTREARVPPDGGAPSPAPGGPGPVALLALLGGLLLAWPWRRHRRGLPPLPRPSLDLGEPALLRARGVRKRHRRRAPRGGLRMGPPSVERAPWDRVVIDNGETRERHRR
ncbi:MAG TPA: hypothetical protein VFA86_00350 [Gammaproteobacteria bacterium]|nr:hypothetical protein [Gammaproteobacteria bacterium]